MPAGGFAFGDLLGMAIADDSTQRESSRCSRSVHVFSNCGQRRSFFTNYCGAAMVSGFGGPFDVKGRERFRRQHGLEGKFVVMYSGNHSLCHPLDTVLDAARMLAGNREVVFCFIGGGAQFHNIERMAGRHKSKSVCDPDARIRCLPYQPLSRLSDSLSAADLHLVVMGEPFVGIVHPCKIYNILKLATPILYVGPKPSPVSEILGEEIGDCLSACVSHGDAAGLVREIRRVLNRSPRRSTARRSRSYARFSRKSVLPRLIAQLEQQDGVTE